MTILNNFLDDFYIIILFLDKSVDLPIAMGMSCSSVCVCVSVCKNREYRSNLGENKKDKKIVFID